MALEISDSVGATMPDGSDSLNSFEDVLVIQYLLNQSGVLDNALPLDGRFTPELTNAIMEFENFEDTVLEIDGRIDPFDTAWVALNNTPLPDFEGVTDPQERRMIIQRPNPEWNFTRGRFKTLMDAGFDLSFDETSTWLPDTIKNRLFLILGSLLDPEILPAPTYGVDASDWHHVHLGFWSGQKNVPVSPAALAWKVEALKMVTEIQRLRRVHLQDLPGFTESLMTLFNGAAMQNLLTRYAQSPEAVMVHHTFEIENWRPLMENTDPRRHWMVNAADDILISPYRSPEELDAADRRGEFICENSLTLCMVIDIFGVIHPVFGIPHDLKIYTGFELRVGAKPPGPPLGP